MSTSTWFTAPKRRTDRTAELTKTRLTSDATNSERSCWLSLILEEMLGVPKDLKSTRCMPWPMPRSKRVNVYGEL